MSMIHNPPGHSPARSSFAEYRKHSSRDLNPFSMADPDDLRNVSRRDSRNTSHSSDSNAPNPFADLLEQSSPPPDRQNPLRSSQGSWNSRSGLVSPWNTTFSAPFRQQRPSISVAPPPPGLPAIPHRLSEPSAFYPPSGASQGTSPLPTPTTPSPFDPYDGSRAVAAGKRRATGKDEFDGPHQFLPKPDDADVEIQESQLVPLKVSLKAQEQEDILTQVNNCLSKCAFDFIAKYQFPIPVEADKKVVQTPSDRDWTEWCHLLKRLATKRRIPMRVLWNGQIKQLVTVLENSLEMRQPAKHQMRLLKDDRNILQLVSAGLQVAKMLKDRDAMVRLDALYGQVERIIHARQTVDFRGYDGPFTGMAQLRNSGPPD